MHLAFPSITVTAILAVTANSNETIVVADGENEDEELLIISKKKWLNAEAAPQGSQKSSVLATGTGIECRPVIIASSEDDEGSSNNNNIDHPDVLGVLAARRSSCRPREQVCRPDESSSLGGRCHDEINLSSSSSSSLFAKQAVATPTSAAARRRRNLNLYADALEGCYETCPEEMCSCGFAAAGQGRLRDCAAEIASVCAANNNDDGDGDDASLSGCFGAYQTEFYKEVGCEFADCLTREKKGVGGDGGASRSYEECKCDYYANYAEYYAAPEKVAAAECCGGATTREEKRACIVPTGAPTASAAPTRTGSPSSLSLSSGSDGAIPPASAADGGNDAPAPPPPEGSQLIADAMAPSSGGGGNNVNNDVAAPPPSTSAGNVNTWNKSLVMTAVAFIGLGAFWFSG